jgi:hypothetical protein
MHLMVRILLVSLATSFFLRASANDSVQFVKTIPCFAKLFTTDAIGNIYVVTRNNSLVKYNANGDSLAVFNEVRQGKITQVDATNPLRILVYFSNYGQILILDNMLTLKSILKLPQIGLQNIRCIANSVDSKIWIYDPFEARLLKVDDKLNTQFSIPMRNILETPLDPIYMVEQDRNLYVVDSTLGIFKFDLFGFYNTSYLFNTNEVQCFKSDIVYWNKTVLVSYNTQTLYEKKLLLPSISDVLQVRVERNKVYIRSSNSIQIYNLN